MELMTKHYGWTGTDLEETQLSTTKDEDECGFTNPAAELTAYGEVVFFNGTDAAIGSDSAQDYLVGST